MEVSAPNNKKKLNTEQLQAIKHGEGPLLIIAGAGTGKTTVITERIKHLILKKGVLPSEILALTFTEKASREMETRIDQALPYGYTQMWVMTFHSFCDRILRREALHIGLDPKYELATEAEITQFVRKYLFKFDLKYFRPLGNPTRFVGAMLSHFSRLQDEDIAPSEYLAWASAKRKAQSAKASKEENIELEKWLELARAYETYEGLKTKDAVIDFGNLIAKTLKLFRDRPNVLKAYQEQFKYVLVDEFQDTNIAQYELLKLLAPPANNANLTTVGDDSQSVYKFRGAAISNIIHFMDDYPKATTIVLTKNYRSTQAILDSSYRLIQFNNPDTLEVKLGITKNLVSVVKPKGGESVQFFHKSRVENEAEAVTRKIQELARDENYNFNDFAVLVRANNHADPFIRAFQRWGVPYQFLGPGKLFKQPEIVDLISYLKVLYDPDDSVSFYRLLSTDPIEIEVKDLVRIISYSKKNHVSLFNAIEKLEEIYIRDDTKEKVQRIVEIINNQIKKINKETAGQLLYGFLEESGLLSKLFHPDTPEAQKRATNISKFFDKLKTYEAEHEDGSVFAVVDWIDLSSELGESPLAADSDWGDVNAVNILTVHSAKGLEFPVVFLVNLVSQRFPSTERSEAIPIPNELIKEVLPQGDFHLQEERRLFYVGMTRARDQLYLTAADYYGEAKREKKLSQFIFEALGDNALAAEQLEEKGEQLSFLDYKPSVHEDTAIPGQAPLHLDYLSYSQIDTFRTCPMHYKMRYVMQLQSPPSAALSFGSCIHATLKEFYMNLKVGEQASRALLSKIYKEKWIREGFFDSSHETKMQELGETYLDGFYKKLYKEGVFPIALEETFNLPISIKDSRVVLGGRIDRVDDLGNGKIEIIDYKTGANVPSQKEVDSDLQLSFYALAAVNTPEIPFNKKPEEIRLSLYYFDQQEKITTTRTKEQLDAAVKEIFEWKEKIENSDFKCSNGYFCQNGCEYKMFCETE